MPKYARVVDYFTQASDRPLRRLAAYYLVLGLVTSALVYFFPVAAKLFSGDRRTTSSMSRSWWRKKSASERVTDAREEFGPHT